jgi:cytochrome c-type biogenesis protein CcmE
MKRRHRRIAFIVVGLVSLGIAAYLAASAFRNNLVFFFSPTQVAAKEAPVDRTFRIGGLVQEGSLKRDGLMYSSP